MAVCRLRRGRGRLGRGHARDSGSAATSAPSTRTPARDHTIDRRAHILDGQGPHRRIGHDDGIASPIPEHAALFVLLGTLTGLIAGAQGVGGGFVLVPVLRLAGLPIHAAIGTSLGFIAVVGAVGGLSHVRQATVDRRLALVCGVAAAAVVQGAARLGRRLDPALLSALFAAMLLVVAAWFLAGRADAGDEPRPDRRRSETTTRRRSTPGRAGVVGLVAGASAGLLGVSAGILTVPLLRRWLGCPMRRAIGTGLVVSFVAALSGLLAYASLGAIRFDVLGAIALGGVPGVLAGARLAVRVPVRTLHKTFGALLLAAAVKPLLDAIG